MPNNPPSVVFVENGDVAPFPTPWGSEYEGAYNSFQNGRKPIYYAGAFYDFVLTTTSPGLPTIRTDVIRAMVSLDQNTWTELDAANAPSALDVGGMGISGYYDFTLKNGVFSLCFMDPSASTLSTIDFVMSVGGGGAWGTLIGGGPLCTEGQAGVVESGLSATNLLRSTAIVVLSTGVKVMLYAFAVPGAFGIVLGKTWMVTLVSGSWQTPVMLDDFTVGGFGLWYSQPLLMLRTPTDVVIPLFAYSTITSGSDPRQPLIRYTTGTISAGVPSLAATQDLPLGQYINDASGIYDAVDDSINLGVVAFNRSTFAGPITNQNIVFVKGIGITATPTFTTTIMAPTNPDATSFNFAPLLSEGDTSTGIYNFLFGYSGELAGSPAAFTNPIVQRATSADRGNTWSGFSTFISAVVTGWGYTQNLSIFPFGNMSATVYTAGTVPAMVISIPADPDGADTFTEFYSQGTAPPPSGTSYIAGKGNWILG